MIVRLSIKDFAIIEKLDIELQNGLNIITGETGSGKSIIIEAMSLALGSRADTSYIRTGCQRALIQLVLDSEDSDSTILLTRELLSSGKSICRINDEIVTLSQLNNFCRKLVDIHGQYDHQSLLNPENHLGQLDAFDTAGLGQLKIQVSDTYNRYSAIEKELNALKKSASDGERQKDYLKFEWEEISAVDLTVGEDAELEELLTIMQNREKIFSGLGLALESLNGENDSAMDKLRFAMKHLKDISPFSTEIASAESNMSDCYYRLEDLVTGLSGYADRFDFDSDRMNEVTEKLETINKLKRKYGDSIEKILQYQEKIQQELDRYENYDEYIHDYTHQLLQIREQLQEQASNLSEARKKVAVKIEQEINRELKELNFQNALFKIQFRENLDSSGQRIFSETGYDSIEFLMTANKGEALKPLVKVASGGEISRIMLAFKRILSDYDRIQTMVFDEIDSGISGTTASIVGMKLAEIAQNRQIICITHLPQIAVMGDSHYRISKISDQLSTYTLIEPIENKDKIMEIARLAGGIEITDTAMHNAEEMLNMATRYKEDKRMSK